MKKKFLTMFSIVFVMAFAVAVYAFNQTSNSNGATASSCRMNDNCPLKNKNAQITEIGTEHSCCTDADCCCKNGSCPMKAIGEKTADCCADCCSGACPMQQKQTATAAVLTEKENVARPTDGV